MMLLLDPLLLTPPNQPGGRLVASSEFWNRVILWANDKRVKVGAEAHELICSEFAKYGYPEHDLALDVPSLRHEYQSAISKLLSRVQVHVVESDERVLSPDYTGSPEQHLALQLDISGTAGAGVYGIATDPSHWGTAAGKTVTIEPPPPGSLELCFEAGMALHAEGEQRLRDFYAGRRLHIVGGQVNQHIASVLCSRLAIDPADLIWTPCEKAKPPRDLDKRWSALDPDRDITVCITGRVGHATSMMAADAARKAGVVHLSTEQPSGMEEALVGFAIREI